ncbi:unnamed protein product [Prunus armeniaca]
MGRPLGKAVEVYRSSQSSKVQEVKIIKAGYTALHIAVSDGKTKVGLYLVEQKLSKPVMGIYTILHVIISGEYFIMRVPTA